MAFLRQPHHQMQTVLGPGLFGIRCQGVVWRFPGNPTTKCKQSRGQDCLGYAANLHYEDCISPKQGGSQPMPFVCSRGGFPQIHIAWTQTQQHTGTHFLAQPSQQHNKGTHKQPRASHAAFAGMAHNPHNIPEWHVFSQPNTPTPSWLLEHEPHQGPTWWRGLLSYMNPIWAKCSKLVGPQWEDNLVRRLGFGGSPHPRTWRVHQNRLVTTVQLAL